MTSQSTNRQISTLEVAPVASPNVPVNVDDACASGALATPPTLEVAAVDIHVSVDLSDFFTQPIRLCLLLDGARLMTTEDAAAAARRLATGATLSLRARANPMAQHNLVLVAHFDGLAEIRGYHFRVESRHEFVVAGPGRADLSVLLHEQTDVPPEQRPTAHWKESGDFAYPPGKMVNIPAADVWLGSLEPSTKTIVEKPRHLVHMNAFAIDYAEVTVEQYRECVSKRGCTVPAAAVEMGRLTEAQRATASSLCNWDKSEKATHPMNCVDWNQASAYCAWAGRRLPTDDEWEYAARGKDARTYPWGSEPPSKQLCWNRREPLSGTCAPGSFYAGRSPFGVVDMAGNVSEWTMTMTSADENDGTNGSTRNCRGGSWHDGEVAAVRSAGRLGLKPTTRSPDLGFRCAK